MKIYEGKTVNLAVENALKDLNVTENDIHTLTVTVEENYIIYNVDGKQTKLRVEDLPESFYIGITACEGIARLYDYTVE